MSPHQTWDFLPGLTLLLLLAGAATAASLDVPPVRGRVNDLAGLMPAGRAHALEERLKRFEVETGHQIALLTIPSLEGEDLEGFSLRVAESWKIGQKGFDNGAILVVAPKDRRLRIEVGYGLEGVLPDAIASRIIREVIVPRFRSNDYAGGIEAGLEATMKVARGESLPEAARAKARPGSRSPAAAELSILLLLGLALLGMITRLSSLRRSDMWVGRGPRRFRGAAAPLGANDFFMGGFGGGGDFGGFSGGGGGFGGGGGGFGGGGASGSW